MLRQRRSSLQLFIPGEAFSATWPSSVTGLVLCCLFTFWSSALFGGSLKIQDAPPFNSNDSPSFSEDVLGIPTGTQKTALTTHYSETPLNLADDAKGMAAPLVSETDFSIGVGEHSRSQEALGALNMMPAFQEAIAIQNATAVIGESPQVTQEIRYRMPKAGEVLLVWWMNGWQAPPLAMRPVGTFEKGGVVHTPMTREGDDFVAKIEMPSGTIITHAFLITKTHEGAKVNLWDANGYPSRYYVTVARSDHPALVLSTVIIPKSPLSQITKGESSSLSAQDIHYEMHEAGEVFLVWGINGWHALAEADQPSGTSLKNAVMHTPMIRRGATFVATVRIPSGSTIDYGFLVTKTRDGSRINVWDATDTFRRTTGMVNEPLFVESNVAFGQGGKSRNDLPNDIYAFVAALMIVDVFFLVFLSRLPRDQRRRFVPLALVCLTVEALFVRLLAVAHGQHLFGASSRLIGDEAGYDYLATAILEGHFFEEPARMPLYPLVLAACYWLFGHSFSPVLHLQAFAGAAAVPLTYLLARRFTPSTASLCAAALIALHPALLVHVMRLHTEAIYTPLLLCAVLALLRSREEPVLRRFAIAGAWLAVANLCRPTAILFPLLLPLLMPDALTIRRKFLAWGVYTGMMVVIMAPWVYHNSQSSPMVLPLGVTNAALWQGSPDYYHLVLEKRRNALEIWNTELNPSRNGRKGALSIEGDRDLADRAVESIRHEPGIYLWYGLQKLWFFWIGNPAIDWPSYAVFSFERMWPYFSTAHVIGVFVSRVLPIAGLLGIILLRHHLKDFLPLLAFCAYFTVIHAATYAEVRYSEPLHPIVAIILAAAVSHAMRSVQENRRRAVMSAPQRV